eukprot:240196_1
MSKKQRLRRHKIGLCCLYCLALIILCFSAYILNTYSLLWQPPIPYHLHLSHTSSPSYFHYTCSSFPSFCESLNLNHIFTISQFNHICESISHQIILNISSLNPLFVLSFRREYFFMLHTTNGTIHSQCNHSLIHNLFQPLHHSKFHHTQHSMLYHTHISKALGTSVYLGFEAMARSMGMNETEIEQRIHRDMYGINIGLHMFKGLRHRVGSFNSCEWLYSYLMNTADTNGYKAPLRVESETPLTVHKLCPQFYNSIILRDPIPHRLSMIAFQNMFDQKRVALYCQNRSSLAWRMCKVVQEMDGFLTEIFDNDMNVGYKVNMDRLQGHQMMKTMYNQTVLMEYINPRQRHFAIGWGFYKITKKVYMNFNTTQLMGWLTNTYVRWIGYAHVDNDTLIDCMDVSYNELKKKHLLNAKRVLLQYDYVMPTYHRSNVMPPGIWQHYAKQIEINILGGNNTRTEPILEEWPVERYLKKTAKEISTDSLRQHFNKSGELQLLIDRNQMDLELFEFAKRIAEADLMFIHAIGQFNIL